MKFFDILFVVVRPRPRPTVALHQPIDARLARDLPLDVHDLLLSMLSRFAKGRTQDAFRHHIFNVKHNAPRRAFGGRSSTTSGTSGSHFYDRRRSILQLGLAATFGTAIVVYAQIQRDPIRNDASTASSSSAARKEDGGMDALASVTLTALDSDDYLSTLVFGSNR